MPGNSFGTLFKITTWGESHGKAIGVVIDGCPAGLELSEADLMVELEKRRPGFSAHTSPRRETDEAEILSGIFEGKTTGAPISIIIPNRDAQSSSYDLIKAIYRPGHAHFTYLHKYGIFDHRGGGRASARETACRVAAGAVAKKLLQHFGISCTAYLSEVGEIRLANSDACEMHAQKQMVQLLEEVKTQGDSVGGVIDVITSTLPIGLGDPLFEKLEANLARAMLSLPATKGFEMGQGFAAARMRGSNHNDSFTVEGECITTRTNHAGGTLGGISSGMPLFFRVAFKPTSSIRAAQESVDLQGNTATFQLPEGSRHDPCVALRAVPVVEAMTALVLADALLMQRSARL